MSKNDVGARSRILLLDDEPNILKALRRVFASEPYDLGVFTDAASALACAKDMEFSLLEREHPGITQVSHGNDGAIILDASGSG